jgi:hypothetical protein
MRNEDHDVQERANDDEKLTHGVGHHPFEVKFRVCLLHEFSRASPWAGYISFFRKTARGIVRTPLEMLCVPKRDLIVLASFLNWATLFNVINNENAINDEAIRRIEKNQGV